MSCDVLSSFEQQSTEQNKTKRTEREKSSLLRLRSIDYVEQRESRFFSLIVCPTKMNRTFQSVFNYTIGNCLPTRRISSHQLQKSEKIFLRSQRKTNVYFLQVRPQTVRDCLWQRQDRVESSKIKVKYFLFIISYKQNQLDCLT